jgi:hypothetical protein
MESESVGVAETVHPANAGRMKTNHFAELRGVGAGRSILEFRNAAEG